jgi:hypothetical protein
MTRKSGFLRAAAIAIAALLSAASASVEGQQTVAVTVGENDLGGVVTSAAGPEAGVWVIAETTELPTKLVKIVATDEQGRYLLPELPKANYDVWVRGYGLVDSRKVQSAPGAVLNLNAVVAPSAAAAAQYYPAQYWYAMLRIPDKNLFPGTGANGNGMSPNMRSQGQWLATLKTQGCNSCHQLGNLPTRTISPALGEFKTSYDAWAYRLQVGPAAEIMVRNIGDLDSQLALRNFADWTDRIAAGELPRAKPQRPQGVERNVVITMWDWGDAKTYLHDEGQDLQRHRGFDRQPAGARSEDQFGQLLQDDAARPAHTVGLVHPVGRLPAAAVAVLGQRAHLEQPDVGAQPDVRSGRQGVADRAHPSAADAGLLPQGLRSSLRQAVPDG